MPRRNKRKKEEVRPTEKPIDLSFLGIPSKYHRSSIDCFNWNNEVWIVSMGPIAPYEFWHEKCWSKPRKYPYVWTEKDVLNRLICSRCGEPIPKLKKFFQLREFLEKL